MAKSSEPKPQNPKKIQLDVPFGYIDENGDHLYWFQNQIIDDQETIDDFVKRGFTLWHEV